MSQDSSLDKELAKRLANQFIFSAVVAFITHYRIEIYSVITKQPDWKISLQNMTFWNLGYLIEIIVVVLIYLTAIFLGSGINYFRIMFSKGTDSLLEKYQLVSLSESYGLHKLILTLQNNIDELKNQVVNKTAITNERIDAFMIGLRFKGKGEVFYSFIEETVRKSNPLIYSNITNSYPNKNVFNKLETGEVIRFFNHFSLNNKVFLVYEFNDKNLSGICLGHEILFRQISSDNNFKWEVLYFSEKETSWTTDKPQIERRYFKLVKDKDGLVFLHAVF